MAGLVRIGTVSSVNYKDGTVAVTYPDKSDSVTAEMPCLAMGEYNMPNAGELVAVVHLSTGTENGICLGAIINAKQKPDVSGKGNFYKRLGTAHMQTENGLLSFHDDSGDIRLEDILKMKDKIAEIETRLGG